jgi:hypothetical protein
MWGRLNMFSSSIIFYYSFLMQQALPTCHSRRVLRLRVASGVRPSPIAHHIYFCHVVMSFLAIYFTTGRLPDVNPAWE